MDELDFEAVDLGDELRQGIEFRFGFAPVVRRRPVPHEWLQLLELHALRESSTVSRSGHRVGRHAPAQVIECRFRKIDPERADCSFSRGCFRASETECTHRY